MCTIISLSNFKPDLHSWNITAPIVSTNMDKSIGVPITEAVKLQLEFDIVEFCITGIIQATASGMIVTIARPMTSRLVELNIFAVPMVRDATYTPIQHSRRAYNKPKYPKKKRDGYLKVDLDLDRTLGAASCRWVGLSGLLLVSRAEVKQIMDGNASGPAICNTSWNESQYLLIASTEVTSHSVGLLSSLAAIVLVLITRAYKEFIQRLFLYLAITATFICTPIILSSAVVNDIHVNIGEEKFLMAMEISLVYFDLVYSLLLCWIGVYVLSLTIGIRRFKSIRYEIIGLATVTITPLTASPVWIIPVVQIPYHCDLMLSISILITLLLSVLMVTISVGAVIFHLCRSGLKCNSSVHVRALKEATPLLTFVVIHQIVVAFLLTYAIVLYLDELPPISLVVLYSYVPAVLYVSIPLFLLCQPRIRHGIRCKKKKRQQQQSVGVWNPSTGIQDVTSQTHYIVPPETSFTEEDALIIKQ